MEVLKVFAMEQNSKQKSKISFSDTDSIEITSSSTGKKKQGYFYIHTDGTRINYI
jgi:hypothetical protein